MTPNFENFPDLVLERIITNSDWKSVLTLRHVCQRLRNFIDVSNPSIFKNINLFGIEILAREEGIDLFFSSHHGSNRIEYFLEEDNSSSQKFKNREVLVENSNAMDLAMTDLELVLRFQKSNLNNFNLVMGFDPEEFEVSEIAQFFPDKLSNALSKINAPLKTENLGFSVFNQSQISKILPFFDSGALKNIVISGSRSVESQIDHRENKIDIEMNEIVKSEQWKNAEEFESDMPDFLENLENLSHFRKVEANFRKMVAEDLDMLKKIYIQNPQFIWFRANYKEIENSENFSNFWGPPFNRNPMEDEYFFRIPESREIFHIRNNKEYKFIWFSKIMNYEVPDGAGVLN